MAKWFLYDSNTGERVTQFPVTRPDFRGDQVTVTGGRPPLHSASSGRIYTDEGREFYPSVVDLEWRDMDDPQVSKSHGKLTISPPDEP